VDLTGWSLGDGSLAANISALDGNLLVLPGEYAVFIPSAAAEDESYINSFPSGAKLILVEGEQIGSGLNDDNDRIYLYDENGNIVTTMGYDCLNSPFLNCGDGNFPTGGSLERKKAGDDDSFELQINPSPGAENSGFSDQTLCPA